MIPFVDLQAQRRRLQGRIEAAIARVVESGAFIMGPPVAELERELAAYVGVRHAIGCASGALALELVLRAWGIGPGDAVLVPAFTFAATAEAPALAGATPVFCDVLPDSFNLDPASLRAGIALARERGLAPRAVIPVDLFGQPCDYEVIGAIARAEGLLVLQDAAQSFGASRHGRRAGAHGDAAATSFYPAKPLGCYGDGGAVFTDSDALAETVRSLLFHGRGPGGQYDNVRVGMTGRLDTIQAAVLLEKLAILDEELAARQAVAERYSAALAGLVTTPRIAAGVRSAWAQYTILTPDRDGLARALRAQGVPSMVYYPRTLADQPAFAPAPRTPLPVARAFAEQVLSLPMHPYLEAADQARVVAAIRAALRVAA
jgi:dTDP-4-amino-4,6-dideoxygalactose transaminase